MVKRDFERNSSRSTKLIPFIFVSLIFHGFLFLFKVDLSSSDDERLVSIKYYNYNEINSDQQKEKEVLPEKIKEELPKGQIVDISKPEFEKKPEKSKFLSEFDSSVDKQTKSDFDPDISVRDRKLRKKLSETVKVETLTEKETFAVGPESRDLSANIEKIKKGDLKGFEGTTGNYQKGKDKEVPGNLAAMDNSTEDGSQFIGGHRIPKRFLPYFNGNDSALTTPSNDFLKDIEKSDETALDTRKFIFSAYFNKIKQAISKHWTPSYVLMINDPGGNLYGRKDRYTKLIVHISSNGSLISAGVETTSGIDFLDREAINAFKMASPFPNPPEVLLNKDNMLEIHFGFMVSME